MIQNYVQYYSENQISEKQTTFELPEKLEELRVKSEKLYNSLNFKGSIKILDKAIRVFIKVHGVNQRELSILFYRRALCYLKCEEIHLAYVDLISVVMLIRDEYYNEMNPFYERVPSNSKVKEIYLSTLKFISQIFTYMNNYPQTLMYLQKIYDMLYMGKIVDSKNQMKEDMLNQKYARFVLEKINQIDGICSKGLKYQCLEEMNDNFYPKFHFRGKWIRHTIKGKENYPKRKFPSCFVYKNFLYLFGGWKEDDTGGAFIGSQLMVSQQITELDKSHKMGNSGLSYKEYIRKRRKLMNEFDKFSGYDCLGDMYRINLDTKEIEMVEYSNKNKRNVPNGRRLGSCVVVGDTMYLYGGEFINSKPYDIFYSFDLKTNKWTRIYDDNVIPKNIDVNYLNSDERDQKFELQDHVGLNYENRFMVVVGGKKNSHGVPVMDVTMYNMKSGKWSTLYEDSENGYGVTCPFPRKDFFCFLKRDSIYVFGGLMNSKSPYYNNPYKKYAKKMDLMGKLEDHFDFCYQDMWNFNIQKKKWKKVVMLGNIPSGRSESNFCFVKKRGKVYMFGGYVLKNNLTTWNSQSRMTNFFYKNETYEISFYNGNLRGNEIIGENRKNDEIAYFRMMMSDKLEDFNDIPPSAGTHIFLCNEKIYAMSGYYVDSYRRLHILRDIFELVLKTNNRGLKKECTCCLQERAFGDKGRCPCKAFYCSRKCQKNDWNWHKTVCKVRKNENKKN